MFAVVLFFVLIVLFFVKWYFERYKFTSLTKRYKSPPGWPFIGIMMDFTQPKDVIKHLLNYYKICGNNFLLCLGNSFTLMITEPKLAEFVMGSTKFIDKADDYKFFTHWFGEGLLTSNGNKWKSHRKVITPSFHYKILEDFVEVFDKASRVLVKKLDKEVGNDNFEVFQYITLCTLDIICETAMGITLNAQDFPDSEYVRSVRDICYAVHIRGFTLHLRYDPIYYLSSTWRKEKKALGVIHKHTESVIQKRKKALAEMNDDSEDVSEFGVKRKSSFLDALLKCRIDGQPLTDDDIREEVDTFMFEGHDTTAISISFTLYLLSKHSDIQEKVYDEIKLLLGEDLEKTATYEILMQMKYLEMVIKESLRLYPSVAAFSRALKEDIEYGGEILPKGLKLALTPYLIHRNPEIYPDPEKFDPERFNIENITKRHPYAYVPFSAGPRNCVGQKFAMLELKSTISKILRCFRLLPAIPEHTVEVTSIVTIQSNNGIKIRLEKR